MQDAVALVTGGGSGIGRAAALRLATEGVRIAVAGIDPDKAAAVQQEISRLGGEALALEVDVRSSASVDLAVDAVVERYGRLDVLVNSAGVMAGRPIVEMSDEDWREGLSVNLDGTFFVTRAAARIMVPQRSGTIVLLASDRGLYGARGRSSYAAAKGGVLALMRSAALELGRHGVTVNAINPGTTDTDLVRSTMTAEMIEQRKAQDPLGRISMPEDIAEIVGFLASSGGRFMTGQLITTRMRVG